MRSQFGFAIAFSALIYGKIVFFSNTAETSIPVMSFYKADLAILSVFQLYGVVDVPVEELRRAGDYGKFRPAAR